MVALNFKPEFVGDIEAGRKRRTIRKYRKKGSPGAGDMLQLYTGLRTKKCEMIMEALCWRVRQVEIDYAGVTLAGKRLCCGYAPAYSGGVDPEGYDGDFARADGFDGFPDMVDFFEKQYGLPFKGQLIEWRE